MPTMHAAGNLCQTECILLRVMHCSAGTAVRTRVLFPKESLMPGFSFSLVVRGQSETREAFSWTEDGCGRGYGWRWEGGRAWTGLWKEDGC